MLSLLRITDIISLLAYVFKLTTFLNTVLPFKSIILYSSSDNSATKLSVNEYKIFSEAYFSFPLLFTKI